MGAADIDQVNNLVKQGGWHIVPIGQLKTPPPFASFEVTNVIPVGDTLQFHGDGGQLIEIPLDRLVIGLEGDEPRIIFFNGPRKVRQQQKKIDGGGWHDVEKILPLVRLDNPAAIKKYRDEQEAARKRAAAEAEAKREAAAKLAAEQHAAWLEELEARTLARIGKSPLTGLKLGKFGITLTFGQDLKLEIGLDGGDLYDAYLALGFAGEEQIDLA